MQSQRGERQGMFGGPEIFDVAEAWMWGVASYESGARPRMTSCMR